MSDEHLDRATELIHMQGGPSNPPPGDHYGCVLLLAMAMDKIIKHLREQT